MSRIATIEVIVPDDVKQDDVFNHMRKAQCVMKLTALTSNPEDPPYALRDVLIKVSYKFRYEREDAAVQNEIYNALQSINNVIQVGKVIEYDQNS